MTEHTTQSIAPDVTLEWIHNNQIALFRVRTVARSQLAAWYEATKKVIDEWPVDRPLLVIHDDNYPGSSFTPTLREYSNKLYVYRPEVLLQTAVILPRTLMNQIVNTFLRTLRRSRREVRVFFTVDDAVNWLKTKAIPEKSNG